MSGTLFVIHIGEFAWEFLGAGVTRRQAKDFDKVVVCTRPGLEAIHADYADEIIPHDLQCIGDCVGAAQETMPTQAELEQHMPSGATFCLPKNAGRKYKEVGEYIVYGHPVADWEGAIVLHARARPYCAWRNWSPANWNRLARALAKAYPARRLVTIGTREQAFPVEDAFDARGWPLASQLDILHSAFAAVGVSSGPMHAASFCKCPHIVWCAGPERFLVQEHYQTSWNPHGTWVRAFTCTTDSWDEPYDNVRGWVFDALAELEKSGAR